MGEFTHFDDKGNARMVDVSEKNDTERVAVAVGSIFLNEEAMQAVLGKKIKKGDVYRGAGCGNHGSETLLGSDSALPYFTASRSKDRV